MDEKGVPPPEILNELTRKMSQWRQTNPNATLTEIEAAVEAELAELRRQLVQEMVQERADAKPRRAGMSAMWPDCQRLTGLAERMAARKRQHWQDHRWVFPQRAHLLHQK